MNAQSLHYPLELDAAAIAALLPHRAPLLLVRQVRVLSDTHYQAQACWDADDPLLQGHFPGAPIVPGVMLIEAAAQAAGVGLLAGDPITRSMGAGHLGMLSAVRKCFFKHPVLPCDVLHMDIHCRRMGDKSVLVATSAQVHAKPAAELECMLTHVPAATLAQVLSAPMLSALGLEPAAQA